MSRAKTARCLACDLPIDGRPLFHPGCVAKLKALLKDLNSWLLKRYQSKESALLCSVLYVDSRVVLDIQQNAGMIRRFTEPRNVSVVGGNELAESAVDSLSRLRDDLIRRWIGNGQAAQARLLGSAPIVTAHDSPLSSLVTVASFSTRCIQEARLFEVSPDDFVELVESIPVASDFSVYLAMVKKKLRLNLLPRVHPDRTGKSGKNFALATDRIERFAEDLALGSLKLRSRAKRYSHTAWVCADKCWSRPYPEKFVADRQRHERLRMTSHDPSNTN